ncbi:MAG: hypothetical protein ACFE0O_03780 [Opitutales bacterium]
MGDPDRKAALERQKALIEEHLRWLEHELAALDAADDQRTSAPTPEATPGTTDSVPEAPTGPAFVRAPTSAESEPTESGIDALPEEFVRDPQASGRQARLGCGIALAVAIGLALFLLFGLPFFLYD